MCKSPLQVISKSIKPDAPLGQAYAQGRNTDVKAVFTGAVKIEADGDLGFAGIAGNGNKTALGRNTGICRFGGLFFQTRRFNRCCFFLVFAVITAQPAFAFVHAGFQLRSQARTDAARRLIACLLFQTAFELRQGGGVFDNRTRVRVWSMSRLLQPVTENWSNAVELCS